MLRLVNVAAAARLLSISPHTVRAWVRAGRLPVVRLGSRVLFDRRALRRFVQERTLSPTKQSDQAPEPVDQPIEP